MTRTVWILRAVWALLPVTAGPALADALAERSGAVQTTVAAAAWAGWGLGLAASLVPRTTTLTALRLLGPAAVVVVGWAVVAAESVGAVAIGAAITGAVAAAALVAHPAVADAFVDGSSYGDERRVALRTPLPLVLGPIPLAWVAFAVAVAAGPLLLAAERWAVGAVALAVGWPAAAALAVRLHTLSRRWLVFVPAGVVVHDPLALTEPVLLQRHLLAAVGPAVEGTDAVDLTGNALGLVLELRPREPVAIGRRRGRDTVESAEVPGMLVSPARPGAALEIARDRRLPVA